MSLVDQWLTEQAQKILDGGGVNVGDFIQLTAWFGDIWAEVVHVYVSDRPSLYSSAYFVHYNKAGTARCIDNTSFSRIRRVVRAADAASLSGIIHACATKRGYGQGCNFTWDQPATKDTPIRGNGSEHRWEHHPSVR